MSNHQSAMWNRQTDLAEQRDVLLGELRGMRTGNQHDNGSLATTPILRGKFCHQNIDQGISIHYGDVVELEDRVHQFELEAGLSINLILRGKVDFRIQGKPYQLSAEAGDCQCTVMAVSASEMVTRYTRKGRTVQKLNIQIPYQWLRKRCQSAQDLEQLQRIFSRTVSIRQFLANPTCQHYVHQVMSLDNDGLNSQLQREHYLLALLSELWQSLLDQLDAPSETPLSPTADARHPTLSQILERAVTESLELSEIAAAAHLSVSSLQRKVKQQFGLTVMEYLRRRRLAMARDALLRGKISIGEAAHMAGYRHASNFCTAFKRYYAVTPEEMLRLPHKS